MDATDSPKSKELRAWARKRAELRQTLKLRAAAFGLGMLVLTPVWAMSEYLSAGGWPRHLSGNGYPGDWSPWVIWVALAWGFYVEMTALVLHYRRPPVAEPEIERELAQLAAHRRR